LSRPPRPKESDAPKHNAAFGGETIAAADLEEQMLSHSAIFSAAAVALPDPYLGEKICAAVVFRRVRAVIAYLEAS
jgi:mycobactin salicyl-AMP ligase